MKSILSSTFRGRHRRRTKGPLGRGLAFLICAAAIAPAGLAPSGRPAAGSVIYVSPSGSDSTGNGTQSSPVQTLQRAQQLVRSRNQNMAADITVLLEPGVYRLSNPLNLGPADSGTNGYSVDWTAADPGTVTVSGAVPVTGWTQFDASKNIWSAPVSPGWHSRQLYVDGSRATLAMGAVPARLTKTSSGYEASNLVMSKWRNPSSIDFVWTGDLGPMVQSECPVASIKGRQISMAQPCWSNSTRRHWNWVGYTVLRTPAFVENAFELLTQPGQFYLDNRLHRLYYIPRSGQNMATADAELPVLSALISGSGSGSEALTNISFSGIEFEYATWLGPSSRDGFSEVQSGYRLTGSGAYRGQGLCHYAGGGTCPYGSWSKEPAAVSVGDDHNIAFKADQFVHMGAAGLDLGDGSQDSSVFGSVFTDISGNGLELGGVDAPLAKPVDQTNGLQVADNHIFGVGVEFPGAVAILEGYAANTTIAHNQIDHVPYSGISIGWGGWPDKGQRAPVESYSHGNRVVDNLIFDYMAVLTDGGAIYTLGIQGSSFATGEVVTGNVIHGQVGWSSALKSDNGATYVTYEHNVSYDNTYDWDGNHVDYRRGRHHGFDPQVVRDNYLQQGYPESSARGSLAGDNAIIDGRDQAPANILAGAGVEPAEASILSWRPDTSDVPNPPSAVSVLYAFDQNAYVTWRPSYAEGSDPVSSYAVTACRMVAGSADCLAPKGVTVDISEQDYESQGYAVVPGLVTGAKYSFEVAAVSLAGMGTASILSSPVRVGRTLSSKPEHISGVIPLPGKDAIRLLWYAPKGSYCPSQSYDSWSGCRTPVLSYLVKSSAGKQYVSAGLSQLVMSNHQGRVLDVIGGLQPGKSYRFSISAWDPAGAGPSVTSYAVTPNS